jgi:hypothetical protein
VGGQYAYARTQTAPDSSKPCVQSAWEAAGPAEQDARNRRVEAPIYTTIFIVSSRPSKLFLVDSTSSITIIDSTPTRGGRTTALTVSVPRGKQANGSSRAARRSKKFHVLKLPLQFDPIKSNRVLTKPLMTKKISTPKRPPGTCKVWKATTNRIENALMPSSARMRFVISCRARFPLSSLLRE